MNDEQRESLVGSFHRVSGMILFSFAKHDDLSPKDQILRNFVARTDMMLKGVLALWNAGDTQDCWILYRCLLDRLFHIHHLSENDEYEVFDDWSFYQQYNANNRISSDIEFRDQSEKDFLAPSDEQKARHKKLSLSPPKWKRPHPEGVAKKMGLSFLYKYGYDYGSTHVHPMSNDGLEDFYTITKLEPKPAFPNSDTVFNNSVLVASMIVQEILNSSNFKWRGSLYSFFENLRKTLQNPEDVEYQRDFLRLGDIFLNGKLCEGN